MADSGRIDELRRRVEKDPASIAFAQLAEEYRRAGRVREAIETCETGLTRHPGYLSARVTLGRALLEMGQLDAAQEELKRVLRTAPENLAALRGLAEIHHRRGELAEALAHYRTALEFARHDAELEHVIGEIAAQLEPSVRAPKVVDGLSFEEAAAELLAFSSGNGDQESAQPAFAVAVPEGFTDAVPDPLEDVFPGMAADAFPEVLPEASAEALPASPEPAPLASPEATAPADEPPGEARPTLAGGESGEEADRQIAALERWLEAIVSEREKRNAPSA